MRSLSLNEVEYKEKVDLSQSKDKAADLKAIHPDLWLSPDGTAVCYSEKEPDWDAMKKENERREKEWLDWCAIEGIEVKK